MPIKNALISKGLKSAGFSPKPKKRTGKCNKSRIASTTPPLAVPSIFVKTIPVTSVASKNTFA